MLAIQCHDRFPRSRIFSQLRELYTGATATWARGTLMLTSFFVLCDYSVKAAPDLFARPVLGGFLKGGVCATAAWAIAWPLEVVKRYACVIRGTELWLSTLF